MKSLCLDFDETITSYPEGFSQLCLLSWSIVIVTLNANVTEKICRKILNIAEDRKVQVEICPYDRLYDYDQWKVEMVMKHNGFIMFDDDDNVYRACKNAGIPCIKVGEIYHD
jgi:hypothetical protein